jgi:hypothetical protein
MLWSVLFDAVMFVMMVERVPRLAHHRAQYVRKKGVSQGPRLRHDSSIMDAVV